MWWWKVRCSSRRIPSNLYEREDGSVWLLWTRSSSQARFGSNGEEGSLLSNIIFLPSRSTFLPRVWKIMNLVLLTFTAILLVRNHCAHFFNSILTLSMSSGRFFPALSPWVSSANMKVSSSEEKGKSSMYTRNRIGPRMLPCRTEMSIFCSDDLWPSISVNCFLSDTSR